MRKARLMYGSVTLCISLIAMSAWAIWERKDLAGVSVIGFHHMGQEFAVNELTIDLGYIGDTGFEGSGTSIVCCVALPRKWRPGLMVDVRWALYDIRNIDDELGRKDYSKARFLGYYRANVEVERYEQASDMVVHFFPGKKVRIVSSGDLPRSEYHPIRLRDPNAARIATQGYRIEALLSEAELKALDKRWQDEKRRYGDWR